MNVNQKNQEINIIKSKNKTTENRINKSELHMQRNNEDIRKNKFFCELMKETSGEFDQEKREKSIINQIREKKQIQVQ